MKGLPQHTKNKYYYNFMQKVSYQQKGDKRQLEGHNSFKVIKHPQLTPIEERRIKQEKNTKNAINKFNIAPNGKIYNTNFTFKHICLSNLNPNLKDPTNANIYLNPFVAKFTIGHSKPWI